MSSLVIHFRTDGRVKFGASPRSVACGNPLGEIATGVPLSVSCSRCRRTKIFAEAGAYLLAGHNLKSWHRRQQAKRPKWCVWIPLARKYIVRASGQIAWSYDKREAEAAAQSFGGEVIEAKAFAKKLAEDKNQR